MDNAMGIHRRSKMGVIVFLALLPLALSQPCPTRPHTIVNSKPGETNVTLVGMFGVHYPGSTVFSCGAIRERGFQNMMAFQFAVQNFQAKYTSSLQDVNIQGVAIDSCGSPNQLVYDVFNLEQCSEAYGVESSDSVVGYIGPDRSSEAMQVAPLMGELNKTIITHSATSEDLVDAAKFPTLLRTVPSDNEQIPVLLAILKQMSWSKVQTVHSANLYGTSGIESFNAAAKAQDICIVNSITIPEMATSDEMDKVTESLFEHSETRAVIVFANDHYVTQLLQAIKLNAGGNGLFTFIGTNSWANNDDVVAGADDIAYGAITIGLDTDESIVTEFQNYLSSVSLQNPEPWLAEFYQNKFQCKLPNQDSSFTTPCDTSEDSLGDLAVDPYVTNTVAAVEAMLLGLEQARADQCNGLSMCNSFWNDEGKWSAVHEEVRNVELNGARVFNEDTGQAEGIEQLVYNYRTSGYTMVGRFSGGQLSMSELILTYGIEGDTIDNPTSECTADPCAACGDEEASTAATTDSTTASPTSSPDDDVVSDDDSGASSGGVRREGWIIALIVLASLGIFMVVVFEIYILYKMMGSVFIRQWRTIWLGQLLLLGILLCYIVLFAFVPHQTPATCTILRFGIGVSYAMCFSVLLVKLMIILSSKTLGYLKGIFQILMFLFAWLVQIAVDAQWIMLQPGEVNMDNSTGTPVAVCAVGFSDHVQSLIYVMFLIFVCVCLSLKAHGIVTNYREGIFIGLAAGFTVPVWVTWILLGFLSDDKSYEEPCLAYGLFITATLLLLIMFLPKVRQLVTMGDEGIYAEDDVPDYAGSIMAPPSVAAPASMIGHTNVAYLKSPNGQANPVILVDNGTLLRGSSSNMGTVDTEQTKLQYDGDKTEALYLRHPGSSQTMGSTAGSVRSMPISGGLYTLPRQQHRHRDGPVYARSHLQPPPGVRTIDRRAQSEIGFGTTRSVRSVRTAPSVTGSHASGTLRKQKTYLDIGSL